MSEPAVPPRPAKDKRKRFSFTAGSLGLIASVVAITPPFTVALQTYLSRGTELALASSKQDHEIRLQYLDRAIDPTKGLEYRQQVLRFLAEAASDGKLQTWATGELRRVDDDLQATRLEIERLKSELAATNLSYDQELQKRSELQKELERLKGQPKTTDTQIGSSKSAGFDGQPPERNAWAKPGGGGRVCSIDNAGKLSHCAFNSMKTCRARADKCVERPQAVQCYPWHSNITTYGGKWMRSDLTCFLNAEACESGRAKNDSAAATADSFLPSDGPCREENLPWVHVAE